MGTAGGKTLITSRVLRYASSGKLVVHGGYGFYLDLDKRYGLTNRTPHRVNQDTELIETKWFVELEREEEGGEVHWRKVREYSVDGLPKADKSDLSVPIENRVNISPSELYNSDESSYIQEYKNPGSWKFRLILSAILGSLVYLINETFGIAVFIAGLVFTVIQFSGEGSQKEEIKAFNQGVDERKEEVDAAKKRVRQSRVSEFERVISKFANWEKMEGRSFEIAVANDFEADGYSVETTPTINDKGIDLICERNGDRLGVQCKAYNKNVGIAALRELHGVKGQWSDLNRFRVVAFMGLQSRREILRDKIILSCFQLNGTNLILGEKY